MLERCEEKGVRVIEAAVAPAKATRCVLITVDSLGNDDMLTPPRTPRPPERQG